MPLEKEPCPCCGRQKITLVCDDCGASELAPKAEPGWIVVGFKENDREPWYRTYYCPGCAGRHHVADNGGGWLWR